MAGDISMNFDPIEGTEIMEILGLYPADMVTSKNIYKLEKVIKYFQHKEDKRYLLTKLTKQKQGIEKLDHLFNYTQVRQEYDKALREKDVFELAADKISEDKNIPVEKVMSLYDNENRLSDLHKEISLYEK